jgi:hypothetical protein
MHRGRIFSLLGSSILFAKVISQTGFIALNMHDLTREGTALKCAVQNCSLRTEYNTFILSGISKKFKA